MLVEHLNNRFTDCELLSTLITLVHAMKATKSMQSPTGNFLEYGNYAVSVVAAHLFTTVDKVQPQLEWMGFKNILTTQFVDVPANEIMSILSCDSSFSSLYPSLQAT